MENFITTDDPLFSIIALIIVLLLASSVAHLLQKYKKAKEFKILKELTSKYDYQKDDDSLVQLIKKSLLPKDTILFSAKVFERNGDYESAIKLYVQLLKIYTSKTDKEPIMENLGYCYLKSGFYQRSINMYKEILQINHSNVTALNYLLIAYEKIKQYDKALDILEPLEELSVETAKLKRYLEVNILINSTKKSSDIAQTLLSIAGEDEAFNRIVASYLLKTEPTLFWQNIDTFDLSFIADLLYYLDPTLIDIEIASQHQVFKEILLARGLIDEGECLTFEFNILHHLTRQKLTFATLSFEYSCQSCKTLMPIHSNRCSYCQEILTLKPRAVLTHTKPFGEISF